MTNFETQDELEQEIRRIESLGHRAHHTAMKAGYISRRIAGAVEEYRGQYGSGYLVHEPSFSGTKYHEVTYYI